MRPAYCALSVPLIPCPRAATRSCLDLVTILDTLKVSESICMTTNPLNVLHGSALGSVGEVSLTGLLSQQQEPGNDPTSKQRL